MATRTRQALIALALVAGASAITGTLYLNRPPADTAPPEAATVTVDVAEVVPQDLRIRVQAQGTVTPVHETALLAEVSGRVIEVAPQFSVGSFMSRGEVLLRIDPRDYQTSLLRAEAALKSAESNLAQEKGRAEVALREWQKLPTGSQRDQEASDLYLRKPQLEQAQAQLLAARADLDTARDNLDRTIIRAPYDALIRDKHCDLGQFLTPGTPIADVFSVEVAEVRLPIPQSRLEYLELPGLAGESEGAAIDLYTDVGGTVRNWTARLQRTEGVFDERSRALHAVARIDDPYARHHPGREPLRIGTFVNADIEGRLLEGVVALPRFVLRAGNQVWVVDDTMRLRNRQVTILNAGGERAYVSAGLGAGERVSLTGLDSSFAGARVQIVSSTPTDRLDERGSPQRQAGTLGARGDPAGDSSGAEVAGGR